MKGINRWRFCLRKGCSSRRSLKTLTWLRRLGAVGNALAVAAFGIAFATLPAYAACTSFPYTLTNGTTADADQVMANYTYLSGCLFVSPSFSGNVGIGTPSPAFLLQAYSTNANSAINLTNNSSGGSTSYYPGISVTNYMGTGSGQGYFAFQNAGGTAASPTAIQAGANLGELIGQGYNGSSFAEGARIAFTPGQTWSSSTQSTDLWFQTTHHGALSETTDMAIVNGQVGIGTTGPQATLQVMGNIYANSTSNPTGGFYYGGATYGLIIGNYATAPWPGTNGLYVGGASMLMGSVGIGTTSPGYTLQVNGSAAGSSAWQIASDKRLKKNIRPIENALATIEQIHGVRFDWRAPTERPVGRALNLPLMTPQVGFIAQDLEKVLPEAVSVSDTPEKIKSVSESKIVPVLVEAVKELKAENDALRARQTSANDNLKHDNDALRQDVGALQRQLAALEAIVTKREAENAGPVSRHRSPKRTKDS